jgi:beta-mannosidase
VRATLEFERITPEPGPDADSVRHEWVAQVAVGDQAGATLEIGGIATVWDVLVNGAVVASGRSMFERRYVDVAAAVVADDNEVRVVVHPLTDLLDEMPRTPRARWRTMLVDEPRLRWARTQVLGRAPGFAPGPPVVGPYRPMVLATEPAPAVQRAGTWWPHTHGTGSPTGQRTVENRSADSLDLWINGEQVFVRGAVWTPGDLAALDTAKELGFNLVRVTGISAYESDEFYSRCDELGLMVWQDLMFATFDYPLADDGFSAAVEAEVRDQLARLSDHPCVVVVCGSAEHEQQAAMFGVRPDTGTAKELAAFLRPLVEDSGIDAVWVDSSPSGGDLPIRVDTGVAQYFGVGAYLRDLPDARHSGVRFASECLAFANLPDPVVEGGVPKDNGADWDFADVREHYARARYGEEATETERQRVTGEVMADVFGEWRRPASPCGGGIVLWLRDLEPGAGWGLLDHTGRPKPAALALAPTLQPTAVWFVDEGLNGLDVHVAHDPGGSVDLTLTVELLRADGSVIESAEVSWTMEPHGHRHWTADALLGRFADSSYAYRFGPPAHAAVHARLTGPGIDRETTWHVPRVVVTDRQ